MRPHHSTSSHGVRPVTVRRRLAFGAAVVLGVISCGAAVGTGVVGAAPTPQVTAAQPADPSAPSGPDRITVGPPMPVPAGSFGYLATHGLTQQMASVGLSRAVAGLPVPPELRNSNLGFARQLDIAISSALTDQHGCVQLIANPPSTPGNLFDYGFYAVSGQYCP